MSKKDEEIRATREIVSRGAGWRCEVCGKAVPMERGQLAHRIPQRKHLVAKYGEGIIHHHFNMAWTCPTDKCNNAVSIAGNPTEVQHLVEAIVDDIIDEVRLRILMSPAEYRSTVNKLARIAKGEGE